MFSLSRICLQNHQNIRTVSLPQRSCKGSFQISVMKEYLMDIGNILSLGITFSGDNANGGSKARKELVPVQRVNAPCPLAVDVLSRNSSSGDPIYLAFIFITIIIT